MCLKKILEKSYLKTNQTLNISRLSYLKTNVETLGGHQHDFIKHDSAIQIV